MRTVPLSEVKNDKKSPIQIELKKVNIYISLLLPKKSHRILN
jgi:hypothetical protein